MTFFCKLSLKSSVFLPYLYISYFLATYMFYADNNKQQQKIPQNLQKLPLTT